MEKIEIGELNDSTGGASEKGAKGDIMEDEECLDVAEAEWACRVSM